MKAMIVYDSLYGNTQKIAESVAKVLSQRYEVQVTPVGEMTVEKLSGIGLFAVGSPTQQFRPTPLIKTFLNSIPKHILSGVKVASFDTRLTVAEIEKTATLAFFVRIFGYAAQRLEKTLKAKGGQLIVPGEGFYVEGMQGPLVAGELERAEQWAVKLFA